MMRRVGVVGAVGVHILLAACGSSSSGPAMGGGGTDPGDMAGSAGDASAAGASAFAGNGGVGGFGGYGFSGSGGSTGGVLEAGTGGVSAGSAGTPAEGGGSGSGGAGPLDTTPPGPVTLPASGTIGIAGAFECAPVSDVEPGASVYYEMTIDGDYPPTPTVATSAELGAANEICGISQHGRTRISVLQVDAAGNVGAATNYQYVLDTKPPAICSLTASPGPRVYRALPVHLRLKAEVGGTASVDIAGVGTTALYDNGAAGDTVSGDGIYEVNYQLPAGADVSSVVITGHFKDSAGNAAPDYTGEKLYIDGTSTAVSGAMVDDATWTAAGSPYVISGKVAFDEGTILTIEPGAVVIFKPGASLSILGDLSAVGTSDKPISMYGAKLALYGIFDTLTYDETDEQYVTGHRLDHVLMRDGELMFGKQEPFSSAGAYITHSAIGAITGEAPFYFMHGAYVRHSWIGQILNKTSPGATRFVDSYFDSVSVDGWSSARFRYCDVGKLSVDRWYSQFSLDHCDVGQMIATRPTLSGPMAFHDNNLGGTATYALVVKEGAAASPVIDASGNYWGPSTTAQMASLGNKANISAIWDFYDDVTQTKVDYKNWLTSPVAAGPNWGREELAPAGAGDACPGAGGSGGTGGMGGTGGAGAGGGGAGAGGGGAGGTSGGSGGELIGACSNGAAYYCTEYSGGAQHYDALKGSCQITQQTWQDNCSTAAVVGTCTAPYAALSGVTLVTRYYSGVAASLAQLKEGCEVGLQGTWKTP